ncbi:hypothetical protein [Sulfuriroseicoccus oceanibius]|uniref:Uncharacterized protein n=1 Tax=Sulfuriroseicoccus oceanibius TaxID=2707525 RepID=A0A6B3L968_9BACT|nr:hypothetical protein [Sulfuriroseicoccus oceanibius]QQL45354.1 hypothetical protein G3M56_001830 [Sulfuriroseicoccus oceanibius]
MPPFKSTVIRHPRELIIFGALSYVFGALLAALDQSQQAFIRDDCFYIGTLALVSGLILWGSVKFRVLKAGKWIVRGLFVVIAVGWALASYELIVSDIHPAIRLLMLAVFGFFLAGSWLLTWWPTLTIPEFAQAPKQIPSSAAPNR